RRSQAICSQSTCFLARFLQAKPSLEVGCKDRAIQRMPRNSWPKEVSHDLGCCVFRQLEKTGAAVLRTLIETVPNRPGGSRALGQPAARRRSGTTRRSVRLYIPRLVAP